MRRGRAVVEPDGEGRRQWTEKQGRAALDELARSGLSGAAFARSKGVSEKRLGYWRKRLAEPAVEFVSVALPTVAAAQIEIQHGDVVLRVREDIDVEHVARLVGALRTRAC